MSNHIASPPARFRPESAKDFSQRSRRLASWLGLAHQRAQELLARIYGYAHLHELQKELTRPGTPGPFDDPDTARATLTARQREFRIARLVAELRGVDELLLSTHDRKLMSMGLFQTAVVHRLLFNTLLKGGGHAAPGDSLPLDEGPDGDDGPDADAGARRIVAAPSPTNFALSAMVLDVECEEDEDVEWTWTETIVGRFISGYRIVSRKKESAEVVS